MTTSNPRRSIIHTAVYPTQKGVLNSLTHAVPSSAGPIRSSKSQARLLPYPSSSSSPNVSPPPSPPSQSSADAPRAQGRPHATLKPLHQQQSSLISSPGAGPTLSSSSATIRLQRTLSVISDSDSDDDGRTGGGRSISLAARRQVHFAAAKAAEDNVEADRTKETAGGTMNGQARARSPGSKIKKPPGEASRPGRGGYTLSDELGWPAEQYTAVNVRLLELTQGRY